MNKFIMKYQDAISGVLSGYDRIVFRGSLRSLNYPEGMKHYLWATQVRLVEFGVHVHQVSERLKAAVRGQAEAMRRPDHYLDSASTDKEQFARAIAARDGIREGLVCLLGCVEPCRTFEVYRNRESHRLELVARTRKCLFLYQYWMDPEFGFLNARIQTWFPLRCKSV